MEKTPIYGDKFRNKFIQSYNRGVPYRQYASFFKSPEYGNFNKLINKKVVPEAKPVETNISDYNNPMEVNSAADTLGNLFFMGNSDALRARYGDWAAHSNPEWWEYLMGPWLAWRNAPGAIWGTLEGVLWDRTLKPMFKGDFKASGLNTLMNLGETMDLFANPVKGLILGGGEGFMAAIGRSSKVEGRKNFDYDTGAMPLDMVLEIFSDPLNYISWGAAGAAKMLAKTGVKAGLEGAEALVKTAAKVATKELAGEVGEAALKKAVLETAQEVSEAAMSTVLKSGSKDLLSETGEKVVKELAAGFVKRGSKESIDEIVQALTKQQTRRLVKTGAKANAKGIAKGTFGQVANRMRHHKIFKFLDVPFSDEMLKALSTVPIDLTQSASKVAHLGLIQGLSNIYKASEGFQSALMKSVLFSHPAGYAGFAIKKGVLKTWAFVKNNHLIRKLKPYMINGLLDFSQYVDAHKVMYKDAIENAMADFATDTPSGRLFVDSYNETASKHMLNIGAIVEKNLSNPEGLTKSINEYLTTSVNNPASPNKVRTMQEFIETIKELNTKYANNHFIDFEEFLVDTQKQIDNALTLERYKGIETIAHSFDDLELFLKNGVYGFSNLIQNFRVMRPRETVDILLEYEAAAFNIEHYNGDQFFTKLRNTFNSLPENVNGIDMSPHKEVIMKKIDRVVEIRETYRSRISRARVMQDQTAFLKEIRQATSNYKKEMSKHVETFANFYQDSPHLKAYSDLYYRLSQEFENANKNIIKFANEGRSASKIQGTFDKMKNILQTVERSKTLTRPATEQLKGLLDELDKDFMRAWVSDSVISYPGNSVGGFDAKLNELRLAVRNLIDDPTSSKLLEEFGAAYNSVYAEASVRVGFRDATANDLLKEATKEAAHYEVILDALDLFDPYELTNKQIRLKIGEIFYKMKLENMFSTAQLLSNETIGKFMLSLNGAGDETSALANYITHVANNTGDSFSTEFIEAAQKLKNIGKGYSTTKAFVEKLHQMGFSELPDKVTNTMLHNAIFSSLENSEFLTTSSFIDITSSDYTFRKLFNKIQDHINTIQFNQSFALDTLRGTGKGKMPTAAYNEFLLANPRFKNKTHEALADAAFLDWYIEQNPKLNKHFTDNFQYVFLDIEATSLNTSNLNILELAYGLRGTDYDKWINNTIQNKQIPDVTVLDTLFRDVPSEKRVEAFLAKYGNAARTESEALTNFFQYLIDTSRANEKHIKLVAHNGLEYDFPALFHRFDQLLSESPEGSAIRKFNHTSEFQNMRMTYMRGDSPMLMDTLDIMRAEEGIFKLKPRHKERIQTLVKSYANTLNRDGLEKLFMTYDSQTINTLEEIKKTYMEPLLKDTGNPLDAARLMEANAVIEEMFNDLHNLKVENQLLGRTYFEKSIFYSDSGKLVDFGDVSNMSQILYRDADGIYKYGYAKDVVHDLILTYFDLAEGELLDYVTAQKLTKIARKIDKNISGIKNIHRLLPYDAAVTETLTALRIAILDSPSMPTVQKTLFGEFMKTDNATGILSKDLTHRYGVLQYLYNEARHFAGAEVLDKVFISDDARALRTILYDPGTLYSPYVKGTTMNFMEELSHRPAFEIASKAEVEAMLADLNRVHTSLQEIGDYLDDTGSGTALKLKVRSYQPAVDKINTVHKLFVERMSPTLPHRYRRKYMQNIKNYTNAVAIRQTAQILALTDEQLKNLLATHAHRIIRFDAGDIFDNSEFNALLKKFMQRQDSLAKIGVDVITDPNATIVEIVLNKNVKVNVWQGSWVIDGVETKAYDLRALNSLYDDLGEQLQHYDLKQSKWVRDDAMLDAIKQAREGLNHINHGSMGNTLGDMMNQDTLDGIYSNLSEAARKALPSVDELMHDKFFTMNQFNYSNLGSIKSRRMVQHGLPEDFIQIYLKSGEQSALYAKDLIQYMDTFLIDNELSLSNLLNSESIKLAGFANELEAAKHWLKELKTNPEFRLAALVQDKKLSAKLIELRPQTAKQLLEMQKLGAVILPYHVYSTAYNVVNKQFLNMYGQNFLNRFSRIIYMYKMGFLVKPGVILRNLIDGQIKNYIETGDPVGTVQDTFTAIHLLNKHSNAVKDIQKMKNGAFDKESIDFYFNNMLDKAVMTKEEFFFVHNFVTSDASAGLTGNIAKYYEPKNYTKDWTNPEVFKRSGRYADEMAKLTEQGKPTMSFKDWNTAYEAQYIVRDTAGKVSSSSPVKPLTSENPMWNYFTSGMRLVMKPNSYVEQVNRLALLINKSRTGLENTTQMFYSIAKTHFDYALKTPAQRMMELIIPFYSFTMKNLHYWADVVLNKPWAMAIFRDVMTPIWNFDNYTPEELERNKTLQNKILRGNIQLFNSEMTVKINPSIMDAANIVSDPLGSLRERLIPPVSYLDKGLTQGNWSNPQSNIPFVGGIAQSVLGANKNISETGNPLYALNSVFGRTYNYSKKPKYSFKPYVSKSGINAFINSPFGRKRMLGVVPQRKIGTLRIPRYRKNTSSVVNQRVAGSGRTKLRSHYFYTMRNMVPYRIKNFSRYHLYGR